MSSKTSTSSELISLREAARILDVHPETLRRWDNSGKLRAVKINKRGDRKSRPEDVIEQLKTK